MESFEMTCKGEGFDYDAGMQALSRLVKVATDCTGQSLIIAAFLLGLHNGYANPFNLIMLRSLDTNLHADCLAVLQMDYRPRKEIYELVPDGAQFFQHLRAHLTQEG